MPDDDSKIIDAISFIIGQTVNEIAVKAEVSVEAVQKVVRKMLANHDLVRNGRRYKYENSHDEEIGYIHQVAREEL